jgi:hypothetical protein
MPRLCPLIAVAAAALPLSRPPGSSSGLHHDFHDNLYVLLRGCKRFRLYPPDAAPDMYVRGTLKRIYPNGRIVYEGQGDVLPDGSGAALQLLKASFILQQCKQITTTRLMDALWDDHR